MLPTGDCRLIWTGSEFVGRDEHESRHVRQANEIIRPLSRLAETALSGDCCPLILVMLDHLPALLTCSGA